MIVIGGVAIDKQPLYIRGEKVKYIYVGNVKAYEATTGILSGILAEAEGVNRYMYNAVTVAVFDSAYAAAQSAVGGDENTQQTAYDNLRSAIDGLVEATFIVSIKILNIGVGYSRDLMNYITYDGIGTLTFDTTNPAIVSLNGSIATRHLPAGHTAILTISIQEVPGLAQVITSSN